jgi:alpha-tubulin suppressor-like RCC1 family protein
MAGALVMTGTIVLGINVAATAVAAAASTSGDAIFGWGATPTLQLLPAGVTPTQVSEGYETGYAIGSDGNLYSWGANDNGELGDGTGQSINDTPVEVSLPAGVSPVEVAGGTDDGYAIGSNGNLYSWGWNGQGELGIGNNTGPDACPLNGPGQSGPTGPCSTTPVKVDLPPGVTPTAIATSGLPQPGAAYAIGSDGKLYAWGNGQGELGDGNENESDAPVVVPLPAGVTPTAIAGGADNGYAIGSDGNLYAWGDNAWGELGNGSSSTTLSDTPTKVSLPPDVTPVAIAASISNDHGTAYMIGSDGNLYAWGYNGDGELGDGTVTGPETCSIAIPPSGTDQYPCSTTPAKVSLPPGVSPKEIAGNYQGGTATGSDGHIYAWGRYNLGNGCSCGSSTPVAVAIPTGSSPVSLGQGPFSATSYAIVNTPNIAPVTAVLIPSNRASLSGTTALLDATASASYGVAISNVRFVLTGGSYDKSVIGTATPTIYGYLLSWNTTSIPGGTYTLQSLATDAVGDTDYSAGITVTVDNTPPATAVIIPWSGTTLKGTVLLDAWASASYGVNISTVQFVLTGGRYDETVMGTATRTIFGWVFVWNTRSALTGTYTLQSRATDAAGNTAYSAGITVRVAN